AEKLAADQPMRSLEAVGRARRLTLQCLQEVRRSVGALRAASLEDLALPGALAKLGQELSDSTGLDVQLQFDVPDDMHLPPEAAQALYRAAQEGLTNVQRHAQATHARVCLAAPDGTVTLRVEDDGVGPGQGSEATGGGFGVIGLRARVALLGR